MDNLEKYEELLDKLDQFKNGKMESESDEYKVLEEAILAIKDLQARLAELEIIIAEVESKRQWQRARQQEGVAAAKERGIHMGRPRIPLPENYEEVKDKWLHREISSRQAAALFGVSQDTVLRWFKRE